MSRISWLAVALAGLLLVYNSMAYFRGSGTPTETTSPLVVPPEALDFGDAWAQRGFRWTFPVRNSTAETLTVSDLRASCACTSVTPTSFELVSGASIDVTAVLDLTAAFPHGDHSESSSFHVSLQPVYQGIASPAQPLHLTGRVRRTGRVEPQTLTFSSSDAVITDAPAPRKHMTLHPFVAVGDVRATCEPVLASAGVTSPDEHNGPIDIWVMPRADLSLGTHHFDLRIDMSSPDGESLPPLLVPITAVVVPDVQFTPEQLTLGPVSVGSVQTQVVTVRSRTGDSEVVVEGIELQMEGISIEPADVDVPRGCAYRVSQQILSRGKQSGTIVFTLDAASDFKLTVPVTYYGR